MTLPIILACWFLLALPLIIAGAAVLGARLYAMGQHQQVPALMPRFAFTRGAKPDENGSQRARDRLPAV